MTKYVVVEVSDGEINELIFDNIKDAKSCLLKAYMEICMDYQLDTPVDGECWINDDGMSAYAIVNGGYHWDYQDIHWDCKIIEV